MSSARKNSTVLRYLPLAAICALPSAAFAQASPFDTGANSLVSFALTIATPIAVLIVIGLAIAAAVGKSTSSAHRRARAIGESDAAFNLGMAFAVAQTAPPGVDIEINGQAFRTSELRKDRQRGSFLRERSA